MRTLAMNSTRLIFKSNRTLHHLDKCPWKTLWWEKKKKEKTKIYARKCKFAIFCWKNSGFNPKFSCSSQCGAHQFDYVMYVQRLNELSTKLCAANSVISYANESTMRNDSRKLIDAPLTRCVYIWRKVEEPGAKEDTDSESRKQRKHATESNWYNLWKKFKKKTIFIKKRKCFVAVKNHCWSALKSFNFYVRVAE